jgi:glycosyltransferase involved in cell wall biosynthesis
MTGRVVRQRPVQAFVLGWPFANLGGVNEVVRNLVQEFHNFGPLAPLVIQPAATESEDPLSDGTPVVSLPFPTVYTGRHKVARFVKFCVQLPRFFWQLRDLCRRHQIRVVNPHFIGLEYFPLMLFRRLGGFRGRLLLSFHGSDIRGMMQSRGLERYLSRLLLRGADVLVPCSRDLGEEIRMFVPECADRIVPIANGVDIERFLASSKFDLLLPEWTKDRKIVLNIGAFEYKKGHDVLLRAFAEVRNTHPEACLIIAGQQREEFQVTKDLVHQLGLQDAVLLLCDIPHGSLSGLLQSADLFVLSSRWEKGVCGEGFAMALLEAAAAGKPVVSTETCGVRELIEHGESGLIVPTDNPELLGNAIITMLNDRDRAARYARNLQAKVAKVFTWKAAHECYLKLSGLTPRVEQNERVFVQQP